MRFPAKYYLLLTMLLALFGAACGSLVGPVDQIATGPAVWIDKPLPNMIHSPDPIEVLSHASSPNGVTTFELSVDGEVVATNDAPPESQGDTLVYLTQAWIPDGPGTFELSVRAMDGAGEFGPSTSVLVIIEDETEDETPEEEATPTEVNTEAADDACMFEAAVNLFCRVGPGSDWEDDDSMTPGEMARVIGESQDGNYWYVLGPHTGRPCTVPKAPRFGMTTGICSPLPQFTPVPLPTEPPTEVPTATPTITPSPTVTPIPPPA